MSKEARAHARNKERRERKRREREKERKRKRIRRETTGHFGVHSASGRHHHASQETMGHCLRRMENNDGKTNVHI